MNERTKKGVTPGGRPYESTKFGSKQAGSHQTTKVTDKKGTYTKESGTFPSGKKHNGKELEFNQALTERSKKLAAKELFSGKALKKKVKK